VQVFLVRLTPEQIQEENKKQQAIYLIATSVKTLEW